MPSVMSHSCSAQYLSFLCYRLYFKYFKIIEEGFELYSASLVGIPRIRYFRSLATIDPTHDYFCLLVSLQRHSAIQSRAKIGNFWKPALDVSICQYFGITNNNKLREWTSTFQISEIPAQVTTLLDFTAWGVLKNMTIEKE